MFSKITRWGMLLLIPMAVIILECSRGDDENSVEKLLEKQKKIETEKEQLAKEKEQLEKRLDETTEFSEKLRQEKLGDLQAQKMLLEKKLSVVMDSLESTETHIVVLHRQKTTLAQQEQYASEAMGEAREKLKSGVSTIDSEIAKLEQNRLAEEKKIPLNQQKSSIAEKKIEAYQQELELLETQKIALLRENAAESAIQVISDKIAAVEKNIKTEQANLGEARAAIGSSQESIQKIDNWITQLNKSIQAEYDKKGVLDEFITGELEKLREETAQLKSEERMLAAIKEISEKKREELERQLSEIDVQIASLGGQEPVVSAEKQAEVEEELPETTGETDTLAGTEHMEEPLGETGGLSNTWKFTIAIIVFLILLLILFYIIGKRHAAPKQAS